MSIEGLCQKVLLLVNNNKELEKENKQLRNINQLLIENKSQLDLYTKKLKDDTKSNINKLKEKIDILQKYYEDKLNKYKHNSKSIKDKNKKEYDKIKSDITILKGDLQKKNEENEKLKKIVENLKNENIEYKVNWNDIIYPVSVNKLSFNETLINESFNETNYQKKKKEINNLKDEIKKMKSEMTNLINNPNTVIDENKTVENLLTKEKEKTINMENDLKKLKDYCIELENKNNDLLNQLNNQPKFTPDLFIKMFFDINTKLFSSSELNKFYSIYISNNIVGVLQIFSRNCDIIKKQIYEAKFEIDTSYTDLEDNLIHSGTKRTTNSYQLVNDRILKLKKFEFDFINLSEFLKHYLIAQEIVVKMCFSNPNEIQFQPIQNLYNLFEDCLNYQIDDMNDDIIFNRKVILRYAKNQKNCLGLSLEYSYSS